MRYSGRRRSSVVRAAVLEGRLLLHKAALVESDEAMQRPFRVVSPNTDGSVAVRSAAVESSDGTRLVFGTRADRKGTVLLDQVLAVCVLPADVTRRLDGAGTSFWVPAPAVLALPPFDIGLALLQAAADGGSPLVPFDVADTDVRHALRSQEPVTDEPSRSRPHAEVARPWLEPVLGWILVNPAASASRDHEFVLVRGLAPGSHDGSRISVRFPINAGHPDRVVRWGNPQTRRAERFTGWIPALAHVDAQPVALWSASPGRGSSVTYAEVVRAMAQSSGAPFLPLVSRAAENGSQAMGKSTAELASE